MPKFDLDNYETVADRITKFWQDYPTGRIATKMEHISDTGKQFVVWAAVYKDAEDAHPWATGYAEEHFADRGPNETSPLENCETSAIGRALANAGYATTSEFRPSREEMAKVNNHSSSPAPHKAKEVAEQARSGSPKTEVEGDPRWDTILQGAQADPDNKFLNDLAEKGKKYGSLSEKQLGAGFNAARKALQDNPIAAEAPVVAKVEEAFGAVQEGWATGEEPF